MIETKTLFIDLLSNSDIKKNEKIKARLENDGYNLVKETCLFSQARLYYIKEA
jgi:hypothetical protein